MYNFSQLPLITGESGQYQAAENTNKRNQQTRYNAHYALEILSSQATSNFIIQNSLVKKSRNR